MRKVLLTVAASLLAGALMVLPQAPDGAAPAGKAPPGAAGPDAVLATLVNTVCASCHTLAHANSTGTVGPNLDTRLKSDCATATSKRERGATLTACIDTAIINPYKYIPTGYSAGIMPATFGKTLSASQIQALVTFLATMAK